jgi:3-oxoacyl-[acyl-carrier protein] reductase
MPLALITGGDGFLAKAVARELAAAHFEVLAPSHGELDVASAGSVRAFFDQLEGVPDLVVHAAGIHRDSLVASMTEAQWDDVLAVNLRGAFLVSRAALRPMLRRKSGHLVFIGSFAALHGTLGQANYAAAKAGLAGFARSLAREAGSRGVRANCVLPGFLESPMTASLGADQVDAAREAHALKRFNTVGDAARFVVFLDSLSHVSGQVFQLDSRIA